MNFVQEFLEWKEKLVEKYGPTKVEQAFVEFQMLCETNRKFMKASTGKNANLAVEKLLEEEEKSV